MAGTAMANAAAIVSNLRTESRRIAGDPTARGRGRAAESLTASRSWMSVQRSGAGICSTTRNRSRRSIIVFPQEDAEPLAGSMQMHADRARRGPDDVRDLGERVSVAEMQHH